MADGDAVIVGHSVVDRWACHVCTAFNVANAVHCHMCQTQRQILPPPMSLALPHSLAAALPSPAPAPAPLHATAHSHLSFVEAMRPQFSSSPPRPLLLPLPLSPPPAPAAAPASAPAPASPPIQAHDSDSSSPPSSPALVVDEMQINIDCMTCAIAHESHMECGCTRISSCAYVVACSLTRSARCVSVTLRRLIDDPSRSRASLGANTLRSLLWAPVSRSVPQSPAPVPVLAPAPAPAPAAVAPVRALAPPLAPAQLRLRLLPVPFRFRWRRLLLLWIARTRLFLKQCFVTCRLMSAVLCRSSIPILAFSRSRTRNSSSWMLSATNVTRNSSSRLAPSST